MKPYDRARRPAAAAPGTLMIPEGSPPPRIHLMEYDENGFDERDIEDLEALVPYARTTRTTWIDIQGLGDEGTLRRVAEIFGIHRLALADAVNVPQRAKADSYDEHLLIVGRAPCEGTEDLDHVPQVCLLISSGYLVTFQERYFGFFDGVRDRIRSGGGGTIRAAGPGYLGAALLGALVDYYYPVLGDIAQELDDIEEEILLAPTPESVGRVHQLQRRITTLRRVARPQAEALARLYRDASPFLDATARMYLRDAQDGAEQILGRLDSAREVAVDTMSAVLATLGHRQNEVMKILTLVGSVFIPLTFIAGIYGMNFEHMPELKLRLGYPLALSVMGAVALAMLMLFRRRGWLGDGRRRR
jgi:magnesium transporter